MLLRASPMRFRIPQPFGGASPSGSQSTGGSLRRCQPASASLSVPQPGASAQTKPFSYDDLVEPSEDEYDGEQAELQAAPGRVSPSYPQHAREEGVLPRHLELRGGLQMPALSVVLGSQFGPGTTRRIIKTAIRLGYRSLDLSNGHTGEAHVGAALQELFANGEVTREELWISSKLWNGNHRFVTEALKQTLDRLQLSYVDAYLIGWPQACPATGKYPAVRGPHVAHWSERTMFPLEETGEFCSDREHHFVDCWHHMEDMVAQERTRVIGLCNFAPHQVREVCREAFMVQPAILQAERHPYLRNQELVDTCAELGIRFQALIPTGTVDSIPGTIRASTSALQARNDRQATLDPVILEMARELEATPEQIILRWHLQSGVGVCPKVRSDEELADNMVVWHPDLQLTPNQMRRIDGLNRDCRHMLWPETSDHPDYPFKDELPEGYRPGKPAGPLQRVKAKPRADPESGSFADLLGPIYFA